MDIETIRLIDLELYRAIEEYMKNVYNVEMTVTGVEKVAPNKWIIEGKRDA